MHLSSKSKIVAAGVGATLVFGILSAAPSMQAQVTPRSVLDKSIAVTGLTGKDVPAWHIKANYKLNNGSSTESGTLEEWATGPNTWHRTYTEKKVSASDWSLTRTQHVQTKEAKLNLAQLDQRVAAVLTDPLHQAEYLKADVELNGQAGTFAGLVLDCVTAADSVRDASKIDPNVLYPRFCFDVKDATLRYIHTPVSLVTYTDFKPLGNRQVATKVNVNMGGKTAADLEITLLEPLAAADQAQVAPSGNTVPQPYAHQPGDAPLVPVRITECAYTMDARDHQEHGVVTIPVVIRKDGSVKSNGMALGPEHLAIAAGDCVGNYKFEPFKIDGEAVDVSDALLYDFENKAFDGKVGIASEPPPTPVKK